MKRYIFLLIFLLMPIYVSADTIKIDCPETIKKDSEFTCNLIGESKLLISGVSAQVKIGKDLTLLAMITDDKWLGDGKDGDIKIFTDEFVTGNFNIGTIKLKSKGDNNNILIDDVSFYDDNVNTINITAVSKTIEISNKASGESNVTSSSDLVDIKIGNYSIDFTKNISEYTLQIEDEKHLDITPILEDDTAKYKIIGNNNLKNGSKIKINVTTSLGDKKTYILNIQKNKQMGIVEVIFLIIIIALICINARMVIKNRKKEVNKNEA